MPFSFNPGQITQAPGTIGVPAAPGAGLQPAGTSTIKSYPESPFLFLHDRVKPMEIMAYVQLLLILIAALMIFSGVVFFSYSKYLTYTITDTRAKIDAAETTFKDYPFSDMQRLSTRLSSVNTVLSTYVSALSPLKILENVVEDQIYFDKFSFGMDAQGSGNSMSFEVNTNNYKPLIQQLASLNLTRYQKVIQKVQTGKVLDGGTALRMQVTVPVVVQGKLPSEINFLELLSATATEELSKASTTP